MSCFSGCFSSLPGLRCDRSVQCPASLSSWLTLPHQVQQSEEWGIRGGCRPVLPFSCSLWSLGQYFIYLVRPPPFTLQIGLDVLALFCKKKSYGSRINNKLYCSQISKQFVLKKYPLFPEKVNFPIKSWITHNDGTFEGNSGPQSEWG